MQSSVLAIKKQLGQHS